MKGKCMEEKVIIEGNVKEPKGLKRLLKIGIVLIVIGVVFYIIYELSNEVPYTPPYNECDFFVKTVEIWGEAEAREIRRFLWGDAFLVGIGFGSIGIALIVFERIFYAIMHNCRITVTDRRVIGMASFGKRVDLPINQISAIGKAIFSSLAVGTSSGKIRFGFLLNRDEIFEALGNVISNLQTKNENTHSAETSTFQTASQADEILKYKQLLDSGVISQEEFDAKKKQLLGI